MEQKLILSPEQIKRVFNKDINISPAGRICPKVPKPGCTCSNQLCTSNKTCKLYWDTFDLMSVSGCIISYDGSHDSRPVCQCSEYSLDPFDRQLSKMDYPGRNIYLIDSWDKTEYEKYLDVIIDTYEP